MVEHPQPAPQPHALYRFYGDDGQLLYVGITNNPSGRFKRHGETKNWWPEVRGITVEWYDDRPSVLAAETRAIHVENPAYNIQRPNLPTNAVTSDDDYDVDDTNLIDWDCAWCRDEIDDGDGFLALGDQDLFEARHQAAVYDAEERASGDPFFWRPYPQAATWRAMHFWCIPEDRDDQAYYIDIHRVRTFPQLLWWTVHLSGKTWLTDTNWYPMVKRIAAAAGGE